MPTLEKGQSLCDSCVRGERNCPIYPQETDYCIEYRRSNKDTILELVKDMEVSVDVSTDDDDANNRYFGTITDLIRTPGSKNGFTLLVQDALPNF